VTRPIPAACPEEPSRFERAVVEEGAMFRKFVKASATLLRRGTADVLILPSDRRPEGRRPILRVRSRWTRRRVDRRSRFAVSSAPPRTCPRRGPSCGWSRPRPLRRSGRTGRPGRVARRRGGTAARTCRRAPSWWSGRGSVTPACPPRWCGTRGRRGGARRVDHPDPEHRRPGLRLPGTSTPFPSRRVGDKSLSCPLGGEPNQQWAAQPNLPGQRRPRRPQRRPPEPAANRIPAGIDGLPLGSVARPVTARPPESINPSRDRSVRLATRGSGKLRKSRQAVPFSVGAGLVQIQSQDEPEGVRS
jgi:hypothetical protein